MHLLGVRLSLTNPGTVSQRLCYREEALGVTFVLLGPSARQMRPEGAADPVQRELCPHRRGAQ